MQSDRCTGSCQETLYFRAATNWQLLTSVTERSLPTEQRTPFMDSTKMCTAWATAQSNVVSWVRSGLFFQFSGGFPIKVLALFVDFRGSVQRGRTVTTSPVKLPCIVSKLRVWEVEVSYVSCERYQDNVWGDLDNFKIRLLKVAFCNLGEA